MTLATSQDNIPQSCNLFYAYLTEEKLFVVASDPQTEHMRNVAKNPNVAGTIVLETVSVGKIEGLQFKAMMYKAEDNKVITAYFKRFPYAKVLNPLLWIIKPMSMKLTDNRLGFGKKLNWTRDAVLQ